MKITAWCIVKAKHKDRAFDGEAARIAGGRWNRIGIPMIYTADSLALAVLEITVHLSNEDLLQKIYFRIPVQFDKVNGNTRSSMFFFRPTRATLFNQLYHYINASSH
jgi:RES domain-containing protein